MIRHLFVPGLFGPVPGLERDGWPSLPYLEALLARADRLVEPVGYAPGLFALFAVETPAACDLPTAAVCWLADNGETPAGYLLHADPIQLLPDRDSLLAFDLSDDPLGADEIEQLLDAFNAHFNDDGVDLRSSSAGQCYLHCEQPASIQTSPLSSVIGRDLDRYLPAGEGHRRWCGLLNETQMLCHALQFNREREAAGRPTLGGLWFSGGGVLPSPGRSPFAEYVGDDRLSRGLVALCAGGGDDELVVDTVLDRAVMRADPGAWLQALAALESRMPALLDGCDELHVHPGNGTVWRWHARSAWRVWRRKRPLVDYLVAGA